MYQDEVQTWKETICDSQSDILYGKCELYEGTIQTIATMLKRLKRELRTMPKEDICEITFKRLSDILDTIEFAETGKLVFKVGED